jgi:hypothetical protein
MNIPNKSSSKTPLLPTGLFFVANLTWNIVNSLVRAASHSFCHKLDFHDPPAVSGLKSSKLPITLRNQKNRWGVLMDENPCGTGIPMAV